MSIDVHTDRTGLLVYKIHETHTSIRTCIPRVLFKLDAVQKSSIFQGCKMHENAFQSRELSGWRRKQHPGKLGTAGGVFCQFRPLRCCQLPSWELAGFPNGLCTSTCVINPLFNVMPMHLTDLSQPPKQLHYWAMGRTFLVSLCNVIVWSWSYFKLCLAFANYILFCASKGREHNSLVSCFFSLLQITALTVFLLSMPPPHIIRWSIQTLTVLKNQYEDVWNQIR